ncbi:hypothetical protein QR685DRAFT_536630 [Neurospora intermedia]|uniref:Secreted protein n=1 Tax=Neurospora intermedia TaxID=5142 RepID=A0ABR3D142_NEUIN
MEVRALVKTFIITFLLSFRVSARPSQKQNDGRRSASHCRQLQMPDPASAFADLPARQLICHKRLPGPRVTARSAGAARTLYQVAFCLPRWGGQKCFGFTAEKDSPLLSLAVPYTMGGNASLNASGPKDTTTCNGRRRTWPYGRVCQHQYQFAWGFVFPEGGPTDAQRDGRRLGRRTKQPPDGGVPNPEQAGGPKSTRPSSN